GSGGVSVVVRRGVDRFVVLGHFWPGAFLARRPGTGRGASAGWWKDRIQRARECGGRTSPRGGGERRGDIVPWVRAESLTGEAAVCGRCSHRELAGGVDGDGCAIEVLWCSRDRTSGALSR